MGAGSPPIFVDFVTMNHIIVQRVMIMSFVPFTVIKSHNHNRNETDRGQDADVLCICGVADYCHSPTAGHASLSVKASKAHTFLRY